MDNDRFALQTGELGTQRTPAAILLLWNILFTLVSVAEGGGLPQMSLFWWLSRLAGVALVVLLFIGKRNAGLPITVALLLLLSLQSLFAHFRINGLLYTASWAVLCLIAVSAAAPPSGPSGGLPKGLLYLPAGLCLALGVYEFISYVAAMGGGWFFLSGLLYLLNDVLWAMGILFLARALAERPSGGTSAPAAGGPHFHAYVQPEPRRQAVSGAAPSYNAPVRQTAPGVLLVRFSIEQLNRRSGSYGFQSGRLIGQAVPAALLEGMTISDGDSAATLAGREYVCVVSIMAMDSAILKEKIEPLILASKEILENGAYPVTQLVAGTSEPLVVDGVVRNGRIEGRGGWCANGLMSAWEATAEKPAEAAREGGAAQKGAAHWARLADKLAHFHTLTADRTEETAMGEELLSGGDAALQAIVAYLISCASGRQSEYWWSDAAYLVKLIAKFPGADHESIYKKLLAPETNIWEYHTQIKDVAQQELLEMKKTAPGYDPTVIPNEDAQAELKALYNMRGSEDERIKRAIAMRASAENWSDENKAFYYYIIGDALRSRDKDDARKNAFYAAQVFCRPVNTSLGWYELKKTEEYKEHLPSPENARRLHEMLPLPENWEDLLKPYRQ